MNFGLPNATADYKELEQALWRRDLKEALKQGQLLNEVGKRAEAIFPVFERVFRTLILGHFYIDEKGMDFLNSASALGLRGKLQQNKFQVGLKKYSSQELADGLKYIVQADYDVKTGQLPSQMAISILMVNILERGFPKRNLSFGQRLNSV